MKSTVPKQRAAHQAPPPVTPKGYRTRRGFKGFVDLRAQARTRQEQAIHQRLMGDRPRGYVRGMAEFSAEELAALTAKLQQWVQAGLGQPTIMLNSGLEEE